MIMRAQTEKPWRSNSLHGNRDEILDTALKVRIFEDALQSTISQRPKTDWFGSRGNSYLFVERDRSYDLLDQLKVIGNNSSNYRNLHRSVYNSSIKETIHVAGELLKSSGGNVLPTDCFGCKWFVPEAT